MANKSLKFGLVALLASVTGCQFYARSPEEYRDATQKVLDTKAGDIKACYDAGLKNNQSLQGRVAVQFTVEAETGTIKDVKLDPAGTTAPADVSSCVTNSLTGLKLDPPDKRDGIATWTYDFSATPAPAPAPPS
ncbi:MAG TPA: AgmX/PglI C-terminal domain-containing protein [Polyangiaceae bacterium]|nr:AgmX/PglI C-terminal domain-containing protein [Polyangiaceae bacterium]